MQILWWTLSLLLMAAGLIGAVVPILPDTLLIFMGALLHRLTVVPGHTVGWTTIAILGVLMLLAHALDFLAGSLGAKYFGATRWGAFGGVAGTVTGLFFGLPGLIAGPLIGVLLGELLGGRALGAATRSTWGTLLGTTAGMVAKVLIALLMIGWFLVALAV